MVLTPSVKVWARFARDYFTEFAKHIGANGISDISGIVYEMNRDYLSRGLPFSLFYALYGNGPVSTAPPLTPAQRNATN